MAKPKTKKPNAVGLTGLKPSPSDANRSEQAASVLAQAPGEALTTNQGLRISDNQNSLRAGDRGPTLLEDHILREKIMHFDHERIPERVVHARGAGAHGIFEVYKSMRKFTKAGFLQDPQVTTPVFVRFSTVAGFRGSADTARDVRGFSVRFYTAEGNFDLVGNNFPVFFIQDAIKFLDAHHHVGDVGPRHPAQLSNDGGIWCAHFSLRRCGRQVVLREIPLEARARRPLAGLG